MMAGIRGKDTRPEMMLRRELHARGFRYRLHDRRLPGAPDLVFRRYNAVCFVHGCFWHRHAGCRYATTPATRTDFWQTKFDANVMRDRRDRDALLDAGWRVATVWECALKNGAETGVASELARWLRGDDQLFDIGSVG